MLTRFAIVGLVALAASCASLTVKPAASHDTPGVHFIRPWPYLAVTLEKSKEGIKTYKAQVVMLPDADPAAEYVIDWDPGWFGVVTPNFTLTDGWNLTGFTSKVESGSAAAMTALGSLVGAIAGLRASDEPGPGLYKLARTKTEVKDPVTGNARDSWSWTIGEAVYEFPVTSKLQQAVPPQEQ